jgi:quercetin dioxygenase-like cupin family protein
MVVEAKRHQTRNLNLKRYMTANVKIFAAFSVGLFVGRLFGRGNENNLRSTGIHGSIYRIEDIPVRNTAHKDKHGRPVTKQQFLEPFAVPTITGFSVATLKEGQNVPTHEHENMHEFFYILQGTAIFETAKGNEQVSSGTFLHFAPHEPHGIVVPEDNKGEMKMLIAGVVIP